jgi:hypothetical protein
VCGPKTCPDGCCVGDSCFSGRNADKCGHAGEECQACGNCQLCSETGACEIDPASSWNVTCLDATLAQTQADGTPWDKANGSDGIEPDPFCQFEIPARAVSATTAGVSVVFNDTYFASWNQRVTPMNQPITAAALLSTTNAWRLWVGDADGCCSGQPACEVLGPAPVSALTDGGIIFKDLQSCSHLAVAFTCATSSR